MGAFIVSKLRWLLLTLLGILTLTFALTKGIPGDPAYSLAGSRASPETLRHYRQALGLDQPLLVQYARYLGMVLRGDLGYSYYSGRPVTALLAEKFPNTLRLAVVSTVLGTAVGIGIGVLLFAARRSAWGVVLGAASLLFLSMPVFWFSLILILVFVHVLGWVPGVGMGGGAWPYLVLPAAALGSRTAAFLARFLCAEMEQEQHAPYLTTAAAKGLGPWQVVRRHLLRNVLIPVATLVGLDLASYLNGSVLTETIFGWDGVGRLAMDGILKRDYPVILGTVLLGTFFFVIINLGIDLLYLWINPRIRLQAARHDA